MKESFSEYKKTLELNLMGITYLYDGDVISSIDNEYREIRTSNQTSPTFMISSIIKIYNESISHMMSKSKEVTIAEESITRESLFGGNIIDKISDLGINPIYIFASEKGSKLFGITKKVDTKKPFPGYLYNIERFIGINLDIFLSPLIEDPEGETILYAVDKSFQSLVYSIQNMEYKINTIDGYQWEHIMNYKFYDCKFDSHKIVIKNISKIREDKINKILDGGD